MRWEISPIAVSLHVGSWQLNVFWYGLLFASTFVYGLLFFQYLYRREGCPVDDVYDLVLWVLGGTVVGARLGHILFYNPDFYWMHPGEILKVWEGGLASHGAVVGILAGVWMHARLHQDQPFLWVCDRIGMAVPLSGCLIRIGNFFNSEILGVPTAMPWGVIFSRIDEIPRHPVQLYEALAYLGIFVLQYRRYLRGPGVPPPGLLFGRFFVLVFAARFCLEFFKEEQAAFQVAGGLSMGQWLSVPAVLIGAALIIAANRAAGREKHPAETVPRRSID